MTSLNNLFERQKYFLAPLSMRMNLLQELYQCAGGAVSPEERRAQERRTKIYLGMASGAAGLAILIGLGKIAVDMRRWREDAGKEKPPWERDYDTSQ